MNQPPYTQYPEQQPQQYPPQQQYPGQSYQPSIQPQQQYPGQPYQPYGQPSQYQPPVQPPQKKKSKLWLWVLVAIIVIVVIAAVSVGGHSGTSNTGTKTDTTNSGTTPTANQTTSHFKVGDTVKVGTDWQVVVNSVKTDDGGQFSALKSGDTYLVIDISVTNLSGKEQTMSSILNFTLKDSTGQKYDESIDPNASATLDGKVEAGSPLRGIIAYEVPSSVNSFTLAFEPNLLDSGQTIWDLSV